MGCVKQVSDVVLCVINLDQVDHLLIRSLIGEKLIRSQQSSFVRRCFALSAALLFPQRKEGQTDCTVMLSPAEPSGPLVQ